MALEVRSDDLSVTQSELVAVKSALRDGAAYLGMTGETLQRYLLQLMEKENLLLSHKLRGPETPTSAQLQHSAVSPAAEAFIASSETNGLGGVPPPEPAVPVAVDDFDNVAAVSVDPVEVCDVKPPPSGPAAAFNRDSLKEVLTHMCDYEAVALESAKALRALSSLAYKEASVVGANGDLLPQLLRLIDIHRKDDVVQLNATRALCNMAYAPEVALGALAKPKVLAVLLSAIVAGEKKELGTKASEAVARIVSAEVSPEEDRPEAVKAALRNGPGALSGLFIAAASGDSSWQGVATALVLQLIANEVVEAQTVAVSFASSSDAFVAGDPAIGGWLALSKALATVDNPTLPHDLIDAGAIKAAVELMRRSQACGWAQLAGIEAMSSLVGSRFAGLQAFATARGMEVIEAAMARHPDEVVLQTKGVRALASGVQWPEEIQTASGYDVKMSISLTKGAMSRHSDNVELQIAVLEALAKYLDKVPCVDEVQSDGCEGLVKAIMTKHNDVGKVQTWGRIVLDGIGIDRHWAPRGSQQA